MRRQWKNNFKTAEINSGPQLSASLLHKFPGINSPDKMLTNWGRRAEEIGLFRECDQKRYQVKSKALEIYLRTFCGKSDTRNFNLDFYSSKRAYFVPRRNATFMSGTPFPTLLSFLCLLPQSVRTCGCKEQEEYTKNEITCPEKSNWWLVLPQSNLFLKFHSNFRAE